MALAHRQAADGDLARLERFYAIPGVNRRLGTRIGQRASLVALVDSNRHAHTQPAGSSRMRDTQPKQASQPEGIYWLVSPTPGLDHLLLTPALDHYS